MALDERLEGQRSGFIVPSYKLFQQLWIGHPADCSQTEKAFQLLAGTRGISAHDFSLESPGTIPYFKEYCPIEEITSHQFDGSLGKMVGRNQSTLCILLDRTTSWGLITGTGGTIPDSWPN